MSLCATSLLVELYLWLEAYLVISLSMLSRCGWMPPIRLFNLLAWFEWLALLAVSLNGSVRLNEFVRLWLGERYEQVLLLRMRPFRTMDGVRPSSALILCNSLWRRSMVVDARLLLWKCSSLCVLWWWWWCWLWCLCPWACEWLCWPLQKPSPCNINAILQINKKQISFMVSAFGKKKFKKW